MSKKYELVESSKIILRNVIVYRIKALVDIPNIVKAGELGGYIESEKNLSHEGDSWIADNACVYGDAQVYESAKVYGNADVSGNVKVYESAKVYGNAYVSGNVKVYGNACVSDNAHVYGDAKVYDNAQVYGNAKVCKDALILSNDDYTTISGFGRENRTTTFYLSHNNIIMVDCGCFHGNLEEFRLAIRRTYYKNGILSPLGDEYMDIADLMEKRFKRSIRKQIKENASTATV